MPEFNARCVELLIKDDPFLARLYYRRGAKPDDLQVFFNSFVVGDSAAIAKYDKIVAEAKAFGTVK